MARNSDKQKADSQISEKDSEKIPGKKQTQSKPETRASTSDDVAEGSREDVDQSLEHQEHETDHEKNPTLH